mmetsp:Transcript_40389/g.101423  ORF Transcript_40389/g.101423 Transcript_40389/m.101423 type:complete len:259 (-) Transcript_40389:585-1361(-)
MAYGSFGGSLGSCNLPYLTSVPPRSKRCKICSVFDPLGASTSAALASWSRTKNLHICPCRFCSFASNSPKDCSAPNGRLTARPRSSGSRSAFSGFTRISRAPGKRAITISRWFLTVGTTSPQPISKQMMLMYSLCALDSKAWSHRSYLSTCAARCCCEKVTSMPNILTSGRATAPHLGHLGSSPTARCVTGSSPSPWSAGAAQTASEQGVEHCSQRSAPCTSTSWSLSQPALIQWLSMFDVNPKNPRGTVSAQRLTKA